MRLFVDIDDTLVKWDINAPNPDGHYMETPWNVNTKLLEGIKQFAVDNPGALIVIWSAGGQQYADEWSRRFGLEDLVATMDKSKDTAVLVQDGDIVVDDMPSVARGVPRTHGPDEWPE